MCRCVVDTQVVSDSGTFCQGPCSLSSHLPPLLCFRLKLGYALLHDEVSGHTYDVRLKLTEEVLTIQKQDVRLCYGSRPSTSVSVSAPAAPGLV